jgi:hypothetical protein
MCQLITCDPVNITQFTPEQKASQKKLVTTIILTALALVSITLFALCLRACLQGGSPLGLLRANTILWGVIGIPLGVMAMINLCALPLLKCKP